MSNANLHDTASLTDWMPAIDLEIVKENYDSSTDMMLVEIKLDPTIVQPFAFKMIFSLGRDSFSDARPVTKTATCFDQNDQWTYHDVFGCLTFGERKIQFLAQHIRGRFMGTEVVLRDDGMMTIRTLLRGKSASRWIGYLQGKKPLSLQYCWSLKNNVSNPTPCNSRQYA